MKVFVRIIAATIVMTLTACKSCSGLKKTISDAECADESSESCDEFGNTDTGHSDPDQSGQAQLSFANSGFINKAESQAYLIKGLCSDAEQSVALSGDAFGYASCDGNEFEVSYDFSRKSDGKVLIIGKHAGVEARVNLIKDATPPLIAFSASEAINAASASSYRLKGTCSDEGMQVAIDGAASGTSSCKSGNFEKDLDLRALADGALSFSAQHTDQAGNIASANSITLTKDTALQTASLIGTPSATTSSPHYSITVANSETILYQYALVSIVSTCAAASYNGSWISASTPISGSLSAAGSYRLCILTKDQAGNVVIPAEAASMVWQYSSTLPIVTITSNTSIVPANVGAYAIAGSCSENGRIVTIGGSIAASTTCSGGAFSVNVNFTTVNDGTISITADHSDASGLAAVQASASLSKITSTAAAPNPLGLTASADSASAVTLTWTSGGGSTAAYRLAYQSGPTAPADCSSGTTVASGAISGTSHQITGLIHETQYGFRVCAINAVAVSTSGITAAVTTQSQAAPGNPSNLIATVNSSTAITLSWTSGGGTTAGYRIAYQSGATAPADCSSGTTIASGSIIGTSHQISSLTAGTQYAFRVCSINANSTPLVSAGVTSSGSTSSPSAPAEPTGLGATVDSSSALTLNWTSGGGTTAGYRIAYQSGATAPADCASGTTIAAASISGSSHQLTGLTHETLYAFRVCSIDSSATPLVSSGVTSSATTQSQVAPLDPTGLSATVNSSSAITLNWTSGGGTTAGYRIAYQSGATAPADCSGGTMIASASITGTSHQITGLTHELQYSFRVCAINSNATPSVSSGVTANGTTQSLTAPNDPSGLGTTVNSSSAITLAWTSGGGTTAGYRIAYQSGATAPADCSSGTTIASASITGTSHQITGLTHELQYSFRVCAINSNATPSVSSGVTANGTTQSLTAPNDPSGLGTTVNSSSAITLAWTSGGGTTAGYRIAYQSGATAPADCASGTTIASASISGTSHQVGGLNSATQYSFRVCAINANATPNVSAGITASATSGAASSAPDPSAFTATAMANDTIALAWTSGGGTTSGFRVSYATGGTAPASCTTGTQISEATIAAQTTYSVTGLVATQSYSFRVCAADGSSYSTGVAASATTKTLATPTELSSLAASTRRWDKILLTWTNGGGTTTAFKVVYQTGATAPSNCSSGTAVSSTIEPGYHELTGLTDNTQYSIRVCALNDDTVPTLSAGRTATITTLTSSGHRYWRIVVNSIGGNGGKSRIHEMVYTFDNAVQTNQGNTVFTVDIGAFTTSITASTFRAYDGSFTNLTGSWDSNASTFSTTAPYDEASADAISSTLDFGAGKKIDMQGALLTCSTANMAPDSYKFQYADILGTWTTKYTVSSTCNPSLQSYFQSLLGVGNLTVSSSSSGNLVSYTDPPGTTDVGYVIARGTSAVAFSPTNGTTYTAGTQGSDEVLYVGTNLNYTDTGVSVGTFYHYAVWSYDSSQNYSEVSRAYNLASPPGPGSLSLTEADTSMSLSWTSGGGTGTNYILVRNADASVAFRPINQLTYTTGTEVGGEIVYIGTNTSYVDTSAANGHRYYYQLWSFDSNNFYSTQSKTADAVGTTCGGTRYQKACWNVGAVGTDCATTCSALSKVFEPASYVAVMPYQSMTECRALLTGLGLNYGAGSSTTSYTSSRLCAYVPGSSSVIGQSVAGNSGNYSVASASPICSCM